MRFTTSIIIVISIFLLVQNCFAYDDDFDWAYELSDSAKVIYKNKQIQIPYSEIGRLLNENKHWLAYRVIRDAGIFKDKSCIGIFLKEIDRIEKVPRLRDAYYFYRLRLGDDSFLANLLSSFDKDARTTGDHYTVELFGFLPDWQQSGRRLVRHAGYSDGAASQLLCSAILWRRFLYGEHEFKNNWFEAGKRESINYKVLQYFYDDCR